MKNVLKHFLKFHRYKYLIKLSIIIYMNNGRKTKFNSKNLVTKYNIYGRL